MVSPVALEAEKAFLNDTIMVWLSSAGVDGIVYSTAGTDKRVIDGRLVEL